MKRSFFVFAVLFCMTALLGSANAQTSSMVYEYSYKASDELKNCEMKDFKFTSTMFENAIMFHVCKQNNGPAYLFTFCMSSMTEGSPIIDWALASGTDLKEIKITLKLSNGKTISTKAWIKDNTRSDLRGSKHIGSVILSFGGTYDSLAQQLTRYDIESITYMGEILSFGDVKTSATYSSMINDIRTR